MQRDMKYIKELRVKNLLNRNKDIKWELNPHCNILGGPNGAGKTIILEGIEEILKGEKRRMCHWCYDSMSLTIGDNSMMDDTVVTDIRPGSEGINVIFTPSSLEYVTDDLNSLERELWNYKNLDDVPEDLKTLIEIINMKYEGEKYLSSSDFDGEMVFKRYGDDLVLNTNDLSIGEQRYLLMLLSAYKSRSNKSTVMLLDMPEIGMHVDMQKTLLGTLMQINPNIQIICVTHSPCMILDGWYAVVREISQIVVKSEKENK